MQNVITDINKISNTQRKQLFIKVLFWPDL